MGKEWGEVKTGIPIPTKSYHGKQVLKMNGKKYFNVFYGNNTTKGIYFIKNILIL